MEKLPFSRFIFSFGTFSLKFLHLHSHVPEYFSILVISWSTSTSIMCTSKKFKYFSQITHCFNSIWIALGFNELRNKPFAAICQFWLIAFKTTTKHFCKTFCQYANTFLTKIIHSFYTFYFTIIYLYSLDNCVKWKSCLHNESPNCLGNRQCKATQLHTKASELSHQSLSTINLKVEFDKLEILLESLILPKD